MDENQMLAELEQALATEQFEEVKTKSQVFIGKFPENHKVYQFLGQANLATEEFGLAEYAFCKARSINANDTKSLYFLAEMAIAQQNSSLAKARLKSILAIDSTHILALTSLGDLSFVEGDYRGALSLYMRAVNANFKAPLIIIKVAQTYLFLEKYETGLAFIDNNPTTEFNSTITEFKRKFLLFLNKIEEAQECTKLLYDHHPDNPKFILEYAELLKKEADWETIVKLYTKALSLDITEPVKKDIHYDRAQAYIALDKHKDALVDYNHLVDLETSSFYLKQRSQLKLKLGETKGALVDINKAIELAPKTNSSYYERATIYLKAKYYDKAIADFTRVLKLNPTSADAFFGLGRAYIGSGDKNKGIQMLQQAEVYGSPKATEFLITKFPQQTAMLRNRASQKYAQEFKNVIATNKSSPILSQLFDKLWVPEMPKFIEAMSESLALFNKETIKKILDTAAKDMFLITPQGLLLFEGDKTPIEAYYKITIESPFATILELQPTKGGKRTSMRLFTHEGGLALSYPLGGDDEQPRFFLPMSNVTPGQKERLNTKEVDIPYLDSLEDFIKNC